ncbi:DNA methyltransferase [Paenibacillus sp. Y412MC10]|uniref:DNA methyltransferase n=1 Tax=Geobacillus sp. (strain Y412MC10) TaxID=481743 RepID=UPI0021B28504|nr:DNA methyltransferase [Paenibacillus sp. Y412MC10]
MKNSSHPGNTVADFYGGSGSTLTTCDQLDRPCRTIEIDPKFCDVIKNRYKEATGIEPALISRLV